MLRVGNPAASGAIALEADQAWFKQLFELSPDPTWIIGGNRFVECNEAAVTTLGYPSRAALLSVHPSELSPPTQPDGQDSYVKAERMMALARTNGLHRFEWRHTKADGTDFLAEVTLSAIQLADRQVIYCVWRDITERKRVEEALKQSELRLKHAVEGFGGGVWDVNLQTGEAQYSGRWKEMLGYSESEILPNHQEFIDRVHPEDAERVAGIVQDYIDGRTSSYAAEFRFRCRDGSYLWILSRGIGVSLEENGKPLHMIGTHEDITERRQLERQVRQLAFHDPLTQLPNRRLLADRLAQALADSKRTGRYGALMFIDLDKFKVLNDKVGHAAGDQLLVQAAQRMKTCVREVDTVARFGGDEFVVVLGDLNVDKVAATAQAGGIAEKLRSALAEPYALRVKSDGAADATVEHRCTVSIGIVVCRDHEGGPDDLLGLADSAMYQGKEAGSNSIRFYELGG